MGDTPDRTIQYQTVESSHLDAIGYDNKARRLYIRFKSPSVRTYVYESVPQSVFDEFTKSPSKGEYFNSFIKGRFRYSEE